MKKKFATKHQIMIIVHRRKTGSAHTCRRVRANRSHCRGDYVVVGEFFFPHVCRRCCVFCFVFAFGVLFFLSPYQQDLLNADNAHSKLAHVPIADCFRRQRCAGTRQPVCSNDGGSTDARSRNFGSR